MASIAALVINSLEVTLPKFPNLVCPTPIIPTSLIYVTTQNRQINGSFQLKTFDYKKYYLTL